MRSIKRNLLLGERERLTFVGKKIRECRQTIGLSQEELSERCGLNRSYMGAVERGELNMGLLNLLRIADSLGIPPERLLPR